MKKWIVCILLLLCMAGCGQKEVQTEQENVVSEEDLVLTYPGTKELYYNHVAVGDNGIVYTVQYDWDVKAQCISVYDTNGVLIEEKLLNATAGDAFHLESGDGVLYMLAPELNCYNVLYEIDTTTWQARRLYDFYDLTAFQEIVQIGEDIYVLARKSNPPLKQYDQYSNAWSFSYNGVVILKLSFEGEVPVLEEVPIEFPIEMFEMSDGVLGVYCYTEDNGHVVAEYKQGELQVKRQLTKAMYSNFKGCGEGFLYQKSTDRICYGTMEEDTESDVLVASGTFSGLWIKCKDGYFYYKDNNKEEIHRVPIDSILKESKTLQFLSSAWIQENDVPSGCGYKMQRLTLDAEAFALKVLAQDTDFDLYLLSSREHTSYNLKENGAFYPLNEVEGVQEYLDACFPYVKETAMNEDGDIWMIPVALTIPGLVYNKDFCAKNGVDLTQMNLAEFIDFTAESRKENVDYGSVSSLILREALFGQYLAKYDTFDTTLLREYAVQMKDAEVKNWGISISGGQATINSFGTLQNQVADFYYECTVYKTYMNSYLKVMGDTDVLGVMTMPKIEEGIPNMGTMTFMMVNPKSENLEDTLRYISDYTKSMLKVQNSYILADKSTYADTPLAMAFYDLYANGGIVFEMDGEVYDNTFVEYLNGKIELEDMVTEMERRRKVYLGE